MEKIRFHKLIIFSLISLLMLVVLSGCTLSKDKKEEVKTTIDELGVTTQIRIDNSPAFGFSNIILSTAEEIYLSGKITNAVKGIKINIIWRYLTSNTTIGTELLSGNRSYNRPYDFVIDSKPQTSYFASRIALNDISWQVGDYEVIVKVGNQIIKTIDFEIVSNQDFDQFSKKDMLQSLYLGSQINTDNQITIPTKKFSRNQKHIYAVALFRNMPSGTTIKASWWYLDNNQKITDFTQQFSGNGYLPFKISLDDFSRLWSDGLWPVGHYKVNIYVDNTIVTTENFSVN